MSEKNRHPVFKDFRSLAGLGPHKEGQAPSAAASRPDPTRFSAAIKDANRAGRAPYNFVPLPAAWHPVEAPPDGRLYHPDRLTGEIDLEFTALTDFYIRGMQPAGASASPKQQTAPFLVDGKLRLPGCSIRGMIRTLVEILGKAPLHPVNDQQLFFRAVGATPNPRDRNSFEPQAKAYWDQIGLSGAKVQAGYLYGSLRGWKIRPAKTLPGGEKWLRIHTTNEWEIRENIWFKPAGGVFGRLCAAGDPGAIEGTMVCSGRIPPKRSADHRPGRKQWLIPAEDPAAQPKEIDENDLEAYEESGISQEIRNHQRFVYSRQSKGTPCFFVEWKDQRGEPHVSFGHTPFFRLPYRTTTELGVPKENRREKGDPRWDLAQAIFGRVEGESVEGRSGRVRFEDAMVISGGGYEKEPSQVVLGSPKPTTYQHYLVQPSEAIEETICWDGDYQKSANRKAVVRGHKLYWHRPEAPVVTGGKEKVSTSLQVAYKDAKFRSVVHFDNLAPHELGVLVTALQLPSGCAHHLGMGKPLGLGSFRVEVAALRLIDRAARYRSFRAGPERLNTGAADRTTDIAVYLREFAGWYLDKPGLPDPVEALWQDPRLRELHALLTFGRPDSSWHRKTRYLELGKLRGGGTCNEYQYLGYPDRRVMSKRRPLPPATQVREGGPAIPSDPPPDLDRPNPARNLRKERQAAEE